MQRNDGNDEHSCCPVALGPNTPAAIEGETWVATEAAEQTPAAPSSF
jgi:hypothetical protein